MRTNSTVSSLLILAVGGLLYSIATSHSQGPLTPPGAPAPTMKTLDQIEARRPVQSLSAAAPYNITQPGSYYLTGNITVANGDAIAISSDDVSLDLNGFTIRSTLTGSSSGNAVNVSGSRSRLTVRNGSIVSGTTFPANGSAVNAGFSFGISSGAYITQSLVSEIHVTGVAGTGIFLDFQGVVENCTVRDCGSGINAETAQNCSAVNCSETGIIVSQNAMNCSAFVRLTGLSCANATNCTGTSSSSLGLNCTGNATNCSGTSTSYIGLNCANATNCSGTSTGGVGLKCSGSATNCVGSSASGTGISCVAATNCQGTSSGSGDGISTETATGCRGESVSGRGLFANYTAMNSHGISSSGRGLFSGVATNCFGQTATGDYGLVSNLANTCRGWQTDNTGVALVADIAIGCNSAGGTITSASKQLGTP